MGCVASPQLDDPDTISVANRHRSYRTLLVWEKRHNIVLLFVVLCNGPTKRAGVVTMPVSLLGADGVAVAGKYLKMRLFTNGPCARRCKNAKTHDVTSDLAHARREIAVSDTLRRHLRARCVARACRYPFHRSSSGGGSLPRARASTRPCALGPEALYSPLSRRTNAPTLRARDSIGCESAQQSYCQCSDPAVAPCVHR